MEFSRLGDTFINGLGEVVNIEETYFFPLLKGSDVAQNRTKTTERFVLVTQKFVGEQTESINISFYSSLIFWDEKRPIKSSILNSLNLKALKLGLPISSVSLQL